MAEVTLHNYFRSSTSYRVRIALALKGIAYDYVAYHLRDGEHRSKRFTDIHPQGAVPVLEWSDGTVLGQSLAILEFIDDMAPEPRLMPSDVHGKARVRMLSQVIGCDIHPVNNLRILNALRERFGADDAAVSDWFRHWVAEGFAPLEKMLAQSDATGRFSHGDSVTIADLCLVAQVANNGRFNVDMEPYPTIRRIYEACMEIEAFRIAAPANQPDAE